MSKARLLGSTWGHPRGHDCLAAASKAYEARTGVSVSWQRRSLQDFADAPLRKLAGEFDLIVLDHPHVGTAAGSGALMPLADSPEICGRSVGQSFESYVWDARIWAYPIDAACQMSVKRRSFGGSIPELWEDYELGRLGGLRVLTPFLPVDSFCMFLSLVASLGETSLPFSRQEFASAANGRRALSLMKKIYRLGPPEAVGWNPFQVLEILSEGKEFDCSPCLFGYINYVRPGCRSEQLEYVNFPRFRCQAVSRAILGGAGIGVSAFSSESREAAKFAEWVCSKPVQSGIYLQHEGQPAHIDVWDDMRGDSVFGGFFGGARETIDNAWMRPRHPWILRLFDDVCADFQDFFVRDREPGVFLDAINDRYRRAAAPGGAPERPAAPQ